MAPKLCSGPQRRNSERSAQHLISRYFTIPDIPDHAGQSPQLSPIADYRQCGRSLASPPPALDIIPRAHSIADSHADVDRPAGRRSPPSTAPARPLATVAISCAAGRPTITVQRSTGSFLTHFDLSQKCLPLLSRRRVRSPGGQLRRCKWPIPQIGQLLQQCFVSLVGHHHCHWPSILLDDHF